MRSFLLAWLSARQQAGKLALRIEDIDSPRVKPWAMKSTIEDLRWLGLDWDAGPVLDGEQPLGAQTGTTLAYIQSQRMDRYRSVLQQLIDAGAVYPCICSRSDVATAASAPHLDGHALEGPIYPGTCKPRQLDTTNLQQFVWRFKLIDRMVQWVDELQGSMQTNPAQRLGDFVIAKGDGTPAYQLAVVIDDYDMGVSEVVRGDDLIFSTYRQLAILRHFGWTPPRYVHVPLMVGPDGKRLAKRHGDTRISCLRTAGISAEAIVGYLAHTVGLLPQAIPINPQALIGLLDWSVVPRSPTMFSLETGLPELERLTRG